MNRLHPGGPAGRGYERNRPKSCDNHACRVLEQAGVALQGSPRSPQQCVQAPRTTRTLRVLGLLDGRTGANERGVVVQRRPTCRKPTQHLTHSAVGKGRGWRPHTAARIFPRGQRIQLTMWGLKSGREGGWRVRGRDVGGCGVSKRRGVVWEVSRGGSELSGAATITQHA